MKTLDENIDVTIKLLDFLTDFLGVVIYSILDFFPDGLKWIFILIFSILIIYHVIFIWEDYIEILWKPISLLFLYVLWKAYFTLEIFMKDSNLNSNLFEFSVSKYDKYNDAIQGIDKWELISDWFISIPSNVYEYFIDIDFVKGILLIVYLIFIYYVGKFFKFIEEMFPKKETYDDNPGSSFSRSEIRDNEIEDTVRKIQRAIKR